MKNKITLLLGLLFVLTAFTPAKRNITIFTIGDSTMANKKLEGGNPERGWGQMLSRYFTDDITIDNHAVNGRSSKSFINEGRWDAVLSKIQKGDYVFIQFGHNDEKDDPNRHTDPGTTFDANLKKFVEDTRAKGGIPVLFNSIVRRNFGKADGNAVANAIKQDDIRNGIDPKAPKDSIEEGATLIDTHGAYLISPKNVAKELNVTFIDLNSLTHKLVEGMGPQKSKELYLWVEPKTVPALPNGREDNTHLNVHGASVIAEMAVKAVAEAIPELQQYVRHYDLVVAKDGSGDFFTVQEAINAVPDYRKNARTTILIKEGSYKEKVIIPASKNAVSLIGQGEVKITYDDYASKPNIFGENKGTSGSSSCYIYAPDFYAENITFENTSGPVGQAVACFVSADRAYFKKCRFLGFQDTLYTYGKGCRQYYDECYIEGTVDFIFGWSTAVFNRCHIHSIGNGYITAPSTDKGQKYGYVFYNCEITANSDVDKVYLSRPWRPYAQAVFIQCNMGKHILPEGWDNWRNKNNEKTVFYAEYKSKGEGANPGKRVAYSKQLKNTEGYSIEEVLSGNDGWNPSKNGNALLNIKR
ncbi:Rhamnogalacturonan acetylesterase rhgT [uncultured Bacteroides sp.]|uniref:pectinesterase family protein n=1 Tax=Bacteroides cellulolyticus TaxID=2981780 RepID=UPI000821839B|nr:pectinesterase family protein [Bacteroides cellulolyticus]MCU6771469.1 pectinesterase family protein [Bacteroides cellulolyticus]SCH84498.1 Rhamnogalacturonan acetylesterase rhgT [uncultured Bacteroides sp.]